MVEVRSTIALQQWVAARLQAWRDGVDVDVVAMVPRKQESPPGCTGYKTATIQELPHSVTMMDPFHVVCRAGEAVDQVRRRRQQELHVIAAAPATRCSMPGGCCTPARTCSPTASKPGYCLARR